MDTSIFTPTEQEQYAKDLFLADSLNNLNLSSTLANNIKNIVPSKKIAELFEDIIAPEEDYQLLRQAGVNALKEYAFNLKQQFIKENTPPIPEIIPEYEPIDKSDISKAISQGWIFRNNNNRWEVQRENNILNYVMNF